MSGVWGFKKYGGLLLKKMEGSLKKNTFTFRNGEVKS